MNVSFGKIKLYKQTNEITNEQKTVVKNLVRAFAPHPTIPFRYGFDERTGLEMSLDEALKKRRNADVFITCKKNGKVEVKVVKNIGIDKNGKVLSYIPSESYDNKLVNEISMYPYRNLSHRINKFIRRCEYYVRCGNVGINKKTEDRLLADM